MEYAKQMADSIKYLSRNIRPVSTTSSVLVSSSKFLNHPLIRDVVATWMLRRNGRDWPVEADHAMGMFGAIVSLQDDDHIESLFVAERKKNPRFDAWMEERFISPLTPEEFKKFPPGSCGAIMNRQIVEFGFQLQLGLSPELLSHSNNYTYYKSRTPQIHDYEHIVTGGSFDSVGEIIPYFARQANIAKHLSTELAAELNVHGVLGGLRLVSRAGLHYPEIWPLVLDCVARGIRVGQQSEPYFMARFDDVLHLTPVEAREKLGIRGAEDVDSSAASRIFCEQEQERALAAE
jgi:ubiquinone biosynthesis protein Coq4